MADQPTLQAGDSGEWVTYLQQCLSTWDRYDPVPESGTFDDKTTSKLREFQSANGLESSNGVADEATWQALLAIVSGATATQGSADSASAQQAYATEATPMGMQIELKPNGTVVVSATAGQRIKKESQGLDLQTVFGSGATHGYGGMHWFPAKDMEPNDVDVHEFDFAFGTKDHGDSQGNTLEVMHYKVGTWRIGFNVASDECQLNGQDSYQGA
jgi:hypothetical protein